MIKQNSYLSLIGYCLFFCSVLLHGQSQPLFETDEVLQLQLTYSFKDFSKSRKLREKVDARIVEISANGDSIATDIKISLRGKSRTKICRYPPIRLHFKNKAKQGVFVNQNKLKLVTHCKDGFEYENYIKKEFLIYELYNLISEFSVRARMCKITYIDSKNPNRKYTEYGVILEDIKKVATRNKLSNYKRNLRSQEVLQKDNLDKLVFFQYMIGNLDWEIGKQHNIKLLRGTNNGLPVAVPYDFDYSGFVDTDYAVPPESIDVASVKIRVFRGFCRMDFYEKTIEYYLKQKERILGKIQNAKYLSEKESDKVKRYILDFYQTLENKDKRMERITKACRAKHKHVYQN